MQEEFSELPLEQQERVLSELPPDVLQAMARGEWFWTSRPEQIPPEGDWGIHLYLAGRGAGKTRSGAEWLVQRSLDHPVDSSGFPAQRMVMAFSLSDARSTCIEGPSGILRVLHRRGFREHENRKKLPTLHSDVKKLYNYVLSPKPNITFMDTGAQIYFSGASINTPRGYNLADLWLDEIIKWEKPELVWKEGLFPALRADIPGDKPRAFVTTTPKPIILLQEWVKGDREGISMVRGSTFDNSLNLSSDFLRDIKKAYEGTALGRQELYGELLDGIEGALFTWKAINDHRVDIGPEKVAYRTIGVDPGLTGDEEGDEMGVVVAVRAVNDHIYIVADETTRLAGRDAALYAWKQFDRYGCDDLVYENNLGKAWMHQVFTDAFRELQRSGLFPAEVAEPPLKGVDARQGKKLRAEPVAFRYERGWIHHIGVFDKLESQMVAFDPLQSYKHNSPDRLDALVHACRHLIDGEKRRAKFINPARTEIPSLARNRDPYAQYR